MSKKIQTSLATSNQSEDLKEIKLALEPLTKLPSIKNDTQYDKAREQFKLIGQVQKMIKAKKDPIIKPLNESLKRIRELFKPYEEQIEELSSVWGDILGEYVNAREIKRIEALNAIENDKRLKNPATIQAKLNAIDERVEGTMKIKVLEVYAPDEVPLAYFNRDDVRIRKALLAGEEVPGCRLVETLTVTKR